MFGKCCVLANRVTEFHRPKDLSPPTQCRRVHHLSTVTIVCCHCRCRCFCRPSTFPSTFIQRLRCRLVLAPPICRSEPSQRLRGPATSSGAASGQVKIPPSGTNCHAVRSLWPRSKCCVVHNVCLDIHGRFSVSAEFCILPPLPSPWLDSCSIATYLCMSEIFHAHPSHNHPNPCHYTCQYDECWVVPHDG